MIYIGDVSGGFNKTITVSDNGLAFNRRKKSFFYPWEKITNIFPWRKFNVLTVIDKDGNTLSGFVTSHKVHGNVWRNMDYISKTWEKYIRLDIENAKFKYPQWCRKRDDVLTLENVFLGLVGGPVIIAMACGALFENGWELSIFEDWAIIFAFLFGLYGLIFGYFNLIERKRKKIRNVAVDENNLYITYDDNCTKEFNLTSVYKHNLTKGRYKGKIIFYDGKKKLYHLERLSYWPILRKYLLSKLEPSAKTDD